MVSSNGVVRDDRAQVVISSPTHHESTIVLRTTGPHGTALGGRDKKTLFGIVFYGTWGTASARNRIIAIPTIAQGYTGRAK